MKFSRPIKLIGKRVNLCPLDEKDLHIFHRWITDLAVTKTTVSSSKIFTVTDELKWLKDANSKTKEGTSFILAILTKQMKVIGVSTLRDIVIREKAYWGKGYGRETTF